MRRSCGICLAVVGVISFAPLLTHADQTPGRVVNRDRPSSRSVLNLSDQAATPAREAREQEAREQAPSTVVDQTTGTPTPESVAKERKILGRVRGYQVLLDREAKLLAQRMAYAAKIRQQGLEKEDKRLLDQAEEYERRSMAAYLARVKQFEKAQLAAGSQQSQASSPTPPRSTSQPAPRAENHNQSRSSASGSSSSRRTRRPVYRRR